MPVNTFIRWDNVMDILTHYAENNSFMETFKHTANNEKVNLCMQNEFIRYSIFFTTDVLQDQYIIFTVCG